MIKYIFFLLQFSFLYSQNFSGYKFCIDPGHGGHNPANDRHVIPDVGIDFWESESNFQKALHLKSLLESHGAWVILTRNTNDYPNEDEPSLSARSEIANQNNVHWFHSIHSNATGGTNTSTNYTLILVKENISTRQAAFPQAVTMSEKIYNRIREKLRTASYGVRLDYTFYGGTSGGFNLGVLKNLLMPGELSEGSFHDFYPETRRLMNNDYRKMEAYGILNGFMEYYGIPFDTTGIICGIQTDFDTKNLINSSLVKLEPEGKIYNGDNFNNGFYFFDNLKKGTKKIIYETPNFIKDSIEISLSNGETKFYDYTTKSKIPPVITYSLPKNNDTNVAITSQIGFIFSIPMDSNSVKNAFKISPSLDGYFAISNNNKTFVFKNLSPLKNSQNYIIILDSTASSLGGLLLDGNKDGIAGDSFIINFRTQQTTGIANYISQPIDTKLFQNYPNPFNGTSTINFFIDKKSFVTLKIFNAIGEEIFELENNILEKGNHFYKIDSKNLNSGIYFYQLKSQSKTETKTFHIVK